MKNTKDFLKSGVQPTLSMVNLVNKLDSMPVFSKTELGSLAPHILRAILTLRSGQYPMPYVSNEKVVEQILQEQPIDHECA